MHFGVTLSIEILFYVWIVSAAPPTSPHSINESTNNDTKTTSGSPIETLSLDSFFEFYPDTPEDAKERPQEPLKCVKSDSSWMCPKPNIHGSIPLDISFEPTGLDIKCTENISCAQMPVLKDKVDVMQSLRVQWCPALSASCVLQSGAVPAPELRLLSLEDVSLDGLKDLVGLQKLSLVGYGLKSSEPWVVPLQSLANMTSLSTLRIHGGRAILPTGGFSASMSLRHLELANLAMTNLPEKPFAGLDELTSLGLWNNKFKELDRDVFYGLKTLRSLSLNGNLLSNVPKASFAHVPSLTQLTIKSNYITRINAGDFEGLKNLTTLDLSDNRIELVILEGAFSELVALKSLQLVKSRVVALAAMGAPALLELNLSRNLLRTLPSDAFRLAPSLTTLKLDANKLEELPRNLLQFQTKLVMLSICQNQLRDVSSTALAGARNSLHTLRLCKNKISFADNSSYQDLYSPLQDLLYLSELDLSYNLITDVFNDWRYVLLQLQSLNLSHNHIRILVEEATNFLGRNITVDLRYNNITTISLQTAEGAAAEGSAAGEGSSVGEGSALLLAHNPLRCDCRLHGVLRLPRVAAPLTLRAATARLDLAGAVCATPPALRDVPLAALPPQALLCDLRTCPSPCRCRERPEAEAIEVDCGVWPPNGTLPALRSDNYGYAIRLESIPAAKVALANLIALPNRTHVLNCSGLALSDIPISSSNLTEGLIEIDLRNNRLSSVPEWALTERGPRVFLAGNPLSCDCAHGKELARLERQQWRVDYVALRCAGGGAVSAAGGADALCLARDATVAGGALAALGLLLALGALLLWRYSLELRVWLASRGLFTQWINVEELECEFDAFVSYSHLDEKFVIEQLVPALEGARRPRALCLHYRDWRAGEAIAANVACSVQRSRRTLVVLSRNFLASEWGRLEFRVAVAAALRSARGVLVLLLEDVTRDARLGGELAAYIATHTYLRYGDKDFWPRLLRALPPTARRLPARAA